MASSPPSPTHLIRTHITSVNAMHMSDDNERIYSADATGLVVITSTRTLRSLASWKAHEDSLLGVQEWEESIITHGRDNKLHVWKCLQGPTTVIRGSASSPNLSVPVLCYSMDVNALNYCRFSLLPLPAIRRTTERTALIALPNLVESSFADIWTLPCRQRLHAAVGKPANASPLSLDGRGDSQTGIIMSMHLFERSDSSGSQLQLLLAYENGSVNLLRFVKLDTETSVEGIGWESVRNIKIHVESVMTMAVSADNAFAFTVSADHLIGRVDLRAAENQSVSHEECSRAFKTKYPGNGAIAIRDNGKVCAVGGWDGKIRLYSTKTFKSLGTLSYHKNSCQTLVFAKSSPHTTPMVLENDADEDSEDEMGDEEKETRSRWLISGGRDTRVAIWALINFTKP